MVNCSVISCRNKSECKIPGVSFHRFPKDEVKKDQWLAAIGRAGWIPRDTSVVCSLHFPRGYVPRRRGARDVGPIAPSLNRVAPEITEIKDEEESNSSNEDPLSMLQIEVDPKTPEESDEDIDEQPLSTLKRRLSDQEKAEDVPERIQRQSELARKGFKKLKKLQQTVRRIAMKEATLHATIANLRSDINVYKNNRIVILAHDDSTTHKV